MAIDSSDEATLQTVTVTIALDAEEKEKPSPQFDEHLQCLLECEEPPNPQTMVPMLDDKIKISNLNAQVRKILEMLLNTETIGSLKNWEYLASQLGLSMDEIWELRRVEIKNPTETILQKFKSNPVNQLMQIICEMERIDVLISLRPYLNGLSASAAALSMDGDIDSGVFQEPGPSTVPVPPPRMYRPQRTQNFLETAIAENGRIILITHYETNKDLKKLFKLFKHNIKHHAPTSFVIYDINECIDEANLQRIDNFFHSAEQIVVFASQEYTENIATIISATESLANASLLSARRLHQFMNDEYFRNNSTNQRFRVVLPGNEQKEKSLPIGWASNTLVYKFPENFKDLCKKLFETNMNS